MLRMLGAGLVDSLGATRLSYVLKGLLSSSLGSLSDLFDSYCIGPPEHILPVRLECNLALHVGQVELATIDPRIELQPPSIIGGVDTTADCAEEFLLAAADVVQRNRHFGPTSQCLMHLLELLVLLRQRVLALKGDGPIEAASDSRLETGYLLLLTLDLAVGLSNGVVTLHDDGVEASQFNSTILLVDECARQLLGRSSELHRDILARGDELARTGREAPLVFTAPLPLVARHLVGAGLRILLRLLLLLLLLKEAAARHILLTGILLVEALAMVIEKLTTACVLLDSTVVAAPLRGAIALG